MTAPSLREAELWRRWSTALWLIWACLLFGGFLLGPTDETDSQRIPTWARMSSSLTLVVAGWSFYFWMLLPFAKRISLCIALGMSLGFAGDLFMADLVPGVPSVLAGMGAFGLGHVAYIVGVVKLRKRKNSADP